MEQSLHHKIFTETGCVHKDKLLGYHHNTLPAAEKHQMEKHLLDCALCSDAQEGFAIVPAAAESIDELDADMKHLLKTDKSSFSPQWGKLLVAASIAGVLISTFFLFDYKDKETQKHLAEQMPAVEESEMEKLEANELLKEKTGKLQAQQNETGAEGENMNSPIVSDEFAYDSRNAEVGDGYTEQDASDDLASSLQPVASADAKANRQRGQDEGITMASGAVAIPLKDMKADEAKTVSWDIDKVEREVKTLEEAEEMEDAVYFSLAENEKAAEKETTTESSRALKRNKDKSKSFKAIAGKSRMSAKGAEIADAAPAFEAEALKKVEIKSETSGRRDRFVTVNKTDYKIADDAEKNEDNDDKLMLIDGEGLPSKFANEEAKKKAEKQAPETSSETTIQLTYDEVLKKGITEYDEGNYTEALAQFDLILQNFPGDLNGIFYSGLANYRLSRNEAAQAQLQQVIESKNTTFRQEARWYQALTYEKMNDRTNARKSLRKIADEEGFYNKQAQEKLEEIK